MRRRASDVTLPTARRRRTESHDRDKWGKSTEGVFLRSGTAKSGVTSQARQIRTFGIRKVTPSGFVGSPRCGGRLGKGKRRRASAGRAGAEAARLSAGTPNRRGFSRRCGWRCGARQSDQVLQDSLAPGLSDDDRGPRPIIASPRRGACFVVYHEIHESMDSGRMVGRRWWANGGHDRHTGRDRRGPGRSHTAAAQDKVVYLRDTRHGDSQRAIRRHGRHGRILSRRPRCDPPTAAGRRLRGLSNSFRRAREARTS